jgi:hypothetical protein
VSKDDRALLTETSLPRRGLIAALGALGAGALMHFKGVGKASATDDGHVVIGSDSGTANEAQSETRLVATPAGGFAQAVFQVLNGGTAVTGIKTALSGISTNGHALYAQSDTDETILAKRTTTSGAAGQTTILARTRHAQGIAIRGVADNNDGDGFGSGTGVAGRSYEGIGVSGTSERGIAIRGAISQAGPNVGTTGVLGLSADTSGVGIRGIGAGNGTGVRGISNAGAFDDSNVANGSGTGVFGKSNTGVGTQGESNTSFGVQGICFGSSVGVLGLAVNGAGVWGQSNTYVGVYGNSLGNATGVYGISQGNGSGTVGESVGGIGLYGIARSPFQPALYAQSMAPNGQFAGRFDGSVVVFGDFSVTGAKAAVVPHPDGSLRTLYAVESPESWFEDYGRTRLINGVARVTLDPDFSALVQQGDYLVFPVAEGNCNGIYVSQRDAKGFEVRECNNGKSTLPLAYKVLARRKDLAGKRLERVDVRIAAKPNVRNPAAERALAVVPPVQPPVSGR